MKTRLFALLFILVSILDFIITCYFYIVFSNSWAYEYSGVEGESNPIVKEILTRFGTDGMLVYKTSLVLFICFVIYRASHSKPRMAYFLSILAFSITCFIALYGVAGIILYNGKF